MAEGLLLVYLLGVVFSLALMLTFNIKVMRQSWTFQLWITILAGVLSWIVPLCIVFTCLVKILDERL